MDNLNVADIIQNAFDKRPQGVEDAFNNVIQQKMADAIQARREELAQSMYGSEDQVEDDDYDVDVEPEEDLDQVDIEDTTDEDF